MSKLKVYISPSDQQQHQLQRKHQQMEKNINSSNYQHEYNAELINKNITNTIKKFSSERSLFFSNLNDAIHDCNSKWMGEDQTIRFNRNESTSTSTNTRPAPPRKEVPVTDEGAAVVTLRRRNGPSNASCKLPSGRASMAEGGNGNGVGGGRSGKGWREALLRRCKSTKDLFQTGFMGNHGSGTANSKASGKEEKLPSFRKTENLDDFDKYYLLSGNRKNIVKELRKNFEGQTSSGSSASSSSQQNSFVEVLHNNDITEGKPPQVNKCNASSGSDRSHHNNTSGPGGGGAEVTRKARRFFEIFSSGKNQNVKSQKSKQGEVLKKTHNKDNKLNCSSPMTESSTQTMEDDLMEPFYLHDKYGMQSRRNLNSVFYGAHEEDGSENLNADQGMENFSTVSSVAAAGLKQSSPTSTQNALLRSKVMEKYGDRVRESESFSKFLSHASDSTPQLKAVTKIDPDLLHKPRNNTLNLYGPRRNSTSNLDDLQRCDMIIENDFESLPPPLNPSFQQQYLDATKKQQPNPACGGQTNAISGGKSAPPEKNLKNYAEKLLATSEHLQPKVNNIEEDLYMLNNNKTRKFAHIKSDSANNVSDFDVELRGELDDFVDPKWCSTTSINSGFGHAAFYRQFGKIRKVTEMV